MNLPNQFQPIQRDGNAKFSSNTVGVTPSGSCGCDNVCVGVCVLGRCTGICT